MKPIFLTAFLLTAAGAQGQSVLGFSGGYYRSTYFDKSETPHFTGTYHSPSTYCFTAFLKPRVHWYVNVGAELSFVHKILDLEITQGGLGSRDYYIDHLNLAALIIPTFQGNILPKLMTKGAILILEGLN